MIRKLSTQNQVIIPDVLPDDMLGFRQDRTMVLVNNLYETRVKPERCLRTPLDETKMGPFHGQQMAVLSTLHIARSYDNGGARETPKTQLSSIFPIKVNPSIPETQRKDHANHVRRSIELLNSNSLEKLRLQKLKQSYDIITEFKRIFPEGQRCLDLAAEVADIGDEMLMGFVQQLTVMNGIDRHEMLYELELLDRFIQQLQYERRRRTSA